MPRGPASSQAWCRRPLCWAASMLFSAASWPSRRLLRQGGGQSYGHSSFSSSLASALVLPLAIPSGSQPFARRPGDGGGDAVDAPCSIDHHAALGILGGDFEEAAAHPGMKIARQALVACLGPAAGRGAQKSALDRQGADQGGGRPEKARGDPVEL